MTDPALAVPTATARATARPASRSRRALPPGVPPWAWLFGVSVVPLTREDGPAWVVSAGAGTTHAVALVFDDPDHD